MPVTQRAVVHIGAEPSLCAVNYRIALRRPASPERHARCSNQELSRQAAAVLAVVISCSSVASSAARTTSTGRDAWCSTPVDTAEDDALERAPSVRPAS
jgi:hypothetical protein